MTRRLLLIEAACAIAAAAQQPMLAPLDEAGFEKVKKSHAGSVLLVNFWATWCQPCRAEMPLLLKLEARYRSSGLKLVNISCDEPEQEAGALQFLKKQGAPLPAYIKRPRNDDTFINSIDPKWSGALPALFLYDRQGRKVKSFIGETDMASLHEALRKLL
ncbi:MAG: TlpA family protein disulfide reductase [Rhodospirillales bacterium]